MSSELSSLQSYVVFQYNAIEDGVTSHGQAYVNITQRAEMLANGNVSDAISFMARVIVGDDIARPRNGGEYWAGWGPAGASGFAPAFIDDSRQIIHATAGLYLADKYGALGYGAAIGREAYTNLVRGEMEYADYNLFYASWQAANRAGDVGLANSIYEQMMDSREFSVTTPYYAPQCFLAGTKINMWPLTDGKAWTKPIETMTPDDLVVSYDDEGNLVPGRVTRTFQNTAKHILDLPVPVLKDVDHKLPQGSISSGQNQMYNLMITPGHVTYCAKVEGEDNPYADSHVPILDILRSDGALMMKDGTLVRASTGCDVGSFLDRKIWAVAGRKDAFGQITISDKGQIRLGTKFVTDDGRIQTVLDMIGQMGAMLNQDGVLVRGPQDKVGTIFHWEHSYKLPNSEGYVLQRSNLTLEEIYDADEWEGVVPDMPAPKPMMVPSTPRERVLQASSKDAMPPNIPTSMFDAPNRPTMSRKQRRAHEAKIRKQTKKARAGATVH